ncbi:hypothetical protein N7497_001727 [Penicillium chrysogenum]|nr:hypothetical protein N7524_009967 [Penicillium chrysogenum]KAJ6168884.1 hypothetical protein N7497_001727 [Penicillium chrysogenum]
MSVRSCITLKLQLQYQEAFTRRTTKQCKLAVLLTDLASLDEWKLPVPLNLPSETSTSGRHDPVTSLTYITYMYYQSVKEVRQRLLTAVSQIIRHSETLYDVTDCVAVSTNHVLQLAYATTQNLFEDKPRQLRSSNNILGRASIISMLPKANRPTSWQDAFIRCPSAYLLILTPLDYAMSTERLPPLPEIVRDLILNDINIELEPEKDPTPQRVQFNCNSSPDAFSQYPTTPSLMLDEPLQHNRVAKQTDYDNTAPNLDLMDFADFQSVTKWKVMYWQFRRNPLEHPSFDICAVTLPQSIKAIDSLLFDTFFHEPFEQNWSVG